MIRIGTRHLLAAVLSLTLSCAALSGPAPQFTAHTLDGDTLTNRSLKGKLVLVQFWATWCGYCRRDQPAVESIARANRDLVVLAVDVGEAESTVRAYLRRNPRSVPIVLDGAAMAKRFGAEGFPYYVLINRDGTIAGTQSGSGGEESLRRLLRKADNARPAEPVMAATQTDEAADFHAKVIEMPRGQDAQPAKPLPKTVFIFTTGERIEADTYKLDNGKVHAMVAGQPRVFAFNTLDLKATTEANHERGVEVHFPRNKSEVFLAF